MPRLCCLALMASKKTSRKTEKRTKTAPKKAKAPARSKEVMKKAKPTASTSSKPKTATKESPSSNSTAIKTVLKKPLFPFNRNKDAVTARRGKAPTEEKTAKVTLSKKFLDQQRKHLLELRDHILDQMQGVAQDSLRSRSDDGSSSAFGMHQADAGSDAYEKDFALSLLSQEQDALYEVNEALKRIENSTYGVCEMSGDSIPPERLEAIPFARYTVACQAKFEKENHDKNRWDTSPQFMDSAENFFEEEEEGEEEDKPKAKE